MQWGPRLLYAPTTALHVVVRHRSFLKVKCKWTEDTPLEPGQIVQDAGVPCGFVYDDGDRVSVWMFPWNRATTSSLRPYDVQNEQSEFVCKVVAAIAPTWARPRFGTETICLRHQKVVAAADSFRRTKGLSTKFALPTERLPTHVVSHWLHPDHVTGAFANVLGVNGQQWVCRKFSDMFHTSRKRLVQ